MKSIQRHLTPSIRLVSKRLQNQAVYLAYPAVKQPSRDYHLTKKNENELIVGGITIMGTALTLQYALNAYQNYQSNKKENPEGTEKESEAAKENLNMKAETKEESQPNTSDKKEEVKKTSGTKGNAFDEFFASWSSKSFYDGGFEEKMTKREAALILGVRESATVERVKDAHRRVLIANHPDKGGSAYIAAKINEAKDLLLKGKQ